MTLAGGGQGSRGGWTRIGEGAGGGRGGEEVVELEEEEEEEKGERSCLI